MKDLIEALNRAHELDESSSEWFTKMKSWLKETGAEEEEFFWSDYHDYVDDIYGRAIEKVTEDYEHINVEFEFSTQAGRGMCQVFGNDDDGSGEYTWDFRDDRDAVFEFVNESTSVEELFNSLVDYLSGKVDCIQWEDNDDYDDEEDFDEALNRAHKLDESNQDYRWFFIGEFKTPERNYVGLWSNLTSKLYVITSDNRIPAQDKKNWMFETTDYNAAKAKLDEIAPQKKYPTGSEVTSLSDIQQFAGCDDFDWTDCTSNLKRTEKQKVLNIVTNNFTLPDGIIRVEWPITAQRIAETLRLHYKNVEVDNNYRVGYHKESAIFYDTPIQGSLDEAAFSGGMAGDNSASGGTIRGRGASTQPGKNNYLNRMKSKNPDLVDTMVIKVSDIKPGMITQAGQVKEAESRNHNSGVKKMYIMHTNGYDGFWGLDETMDVMVDPENKSKPFAGDYRALLKMGLQESAVKAHELDESLHEGREKTVDEANVKTAVCGVLDAAVNTLGKNISYKLLAITLSKEIRPVEWYARVKFVPQGDILQRVDTSHLDYRYGSREANNPECSVSLTIPSNVTLNRSSLLDQESKVVKTITDKYELSQARSSRQDDVDKILQSAKAIARKAGLDARWDSSHERHGSLYLRVVYPQEPDIVFDYGGYPERSLYADQNGLSVYSDAAVTRSPYVPYYKYSGSNDITAILDRFRMNVTDVKDNLDELLSKLNTAKENLAYNKNEDNINRYIEKVVVQSNIPGLVGRYQAEYNRVVFNSINLKSSVIISIHYGCKIDDDSMVEETIKELKYYTYAKLRKPPKKIEI